VAAPKIVIDMMLMEKYGWTPQQVDEIPKTKMEEIMMVLNMKMNVVEEVKWKSEQKSKIDPTSQPPTIGGKGGIKYKQPLT